MKLKAEETVLVLSANSKELSMTASKQSYVRVHDKLYVDGQWVQPAGPGMLDVINSTTE